MMNTKKSYKVTIFGDQYTLVSDESEQRVVQSASLVDTLMKEIAAASKISDHKKIAVLAALRLASKLDALESEVSHSDNEKERLLQRIEKELLSL